MKPFSQGESIGIALALVVVVATFMTSFGNPFAQHGTQDSSKDARPVAINVGTDRDQAAKILAQATDKNGNVTELLFEDTKEGTGRAVGVGDTVAVHYVGALQDGTRFDDSQVRGEPFVFTVGAGSVIKGLDEGIIGMKVRGERVLIIPASMAYGDRGIGVIPPGSTLLFSISLLEIK